MDSGGGAGGPSGGLEQGQREKEIKDDIVVLGFK